MLGIKSELSFHGSQILHVLALTTSPASPRPFLSLIIQPLLYFFEVCKHNRFSPASWPFYMGHSLSTLQMTRSCLSFSSHLKFYFLGEDFIDYPVKCRIVHSCLNLRLLLLSSVSLITGYYSCLLYHLVCVRRAENQEYQCLRAAEGGYLSSSREQICPFCSIQTLNRLDDAHQHWAG